MLDRNDVLAALRPWILNPEVRGHMADDVMLVDRVKETETVGSTSYDVVMDENEYAPLHEQQSRALRRKWEALRASGVEVTAVLAPEGWLGQHTSEWFSLPIFRVPVKGAYRSDITEPRLVI